MIADSPYESGDLVLSPMAGVAAGLIGAAAMLAVVAGLEPVSGHSLSVLLSEISSLILPAPRGAGVTTLTLMFAFGMHGALGAMYGLLYAICQQRASARGLMAVGIFYGVVLWILHALLTRVTLGDAPPSVIRSWTWFLANLAFGSCLAATATWVESRRAAEAGPALPRD
jgi:hypothetical protein